MFHLQLSLVVVFILLLTVHGQRSLHSKIEAESFDVNGGTIIQDHSTASGSKVISHVSHGDLVGYKQLDFTDEAVAVQLRMASHQISDPKNKVQLRLDSPTKEPFVTYTIESTGGWVSWVIVTVFIPLDQRPRGVHDVYFTFESMAADKDVINFDWFSFVLMNSLIPHCPTPTANNYSPTKLCPVSPKCRPCLVEKSSFATDTCENTVNIINIY